MTLSIENVYRQESLPYPLPPPPPEVSDWDNVSKEEIAAYRLWEEAHGEVWRQLEKRLQKNPPLRNSARD